MAGSSGAKEPPPVYAPKPPEWLPHAHRSADLGYTAYYPPYPSQLEDVISDSTVKLGLVIPPVLGAETFSAQGKIAQNDVLEGIEDLINQVFARKGANVPPVPASTFQTPSRVFMNDPKRQAWFADLADSSVPLSKLGKSVPGGAKGHDLLDLLHSKDVAIPRAVWFLRAFGSSETAGLRNKPNYSPTQYSVEWANVVTTYLKKQLNGIALPSAPRPGLNINIKTTFKPVLAEAESRRLWVSRFSYSLELLRHFYSDGLVDHCTFLAWLVLQMSTSNLAQAGFVVRLVDEYLSGVLKSRALSRPLVDGCLSKLAELANSPGHGHLWYLEELLESQLQRILLSRPDAFVSPRMWLLYEETLTRVLQKPLPYTGEDNNNGQTAQAIMDQLHSSFHDIRRRNDALVFRNRRKTVMTRLRSAVQDVQILNSISTTTDLNKVTFFEGRYDDAAFFVKKLDVLLAWSVTSLQYGDHRIYAAVSLVRQWRAKAEERASRRDESSPDELMHDSLFDWLDTAEVAGEPTNLPVVAQLYGELAQCELFSVSQYITRLISRGEIGVSFTQDETSSRHRSFLRWMPIHDSTPALMNQRKSTLYGVRARETPEDKNERQIRKELRAILPEVFGGMQEADAPRSGDVLKQRCQTLYSSPRYEQIRTMRHWLFPILRSHLSSQNSPSENLSRTYSTAVLIMEQVQSYGCILDISLVMLEHASSNDLLTAAIETFRRHINVWSSMDVIGRITAALFTSHLAWKARALPRRSLLTLLEDMDAHRHLHPAESEQLKADMASFRQTLCPVLDHPNPVPSVMPEILLLADEFNPDAPSLLASSLWYKYRGAPDWAWKVWDNTIASLRQVPVIMIEQDARRLCASRYSIFLLSIDQHLPGGFDEQVLQWFLGPGKAELSALTPDAWDLVNFVLLRLAVNGALTVTTILRGVIYTAWQCGASVTSSEQAQSLEVMMRAANELCNHLLLRMDGTEDGTPPIDLLEVQRMRTHRQAVYREPDISVLINNIPTLVFVENNVHISEELRSWAKSLRLSICRRNRFRQGVYRNLDNVRAAFEEPLASDTISSELHEPLVAALRVILDESDESDSSTATLSGWKSASSLLSPWKLAATGIDLQFVLKQAGEGLSQESRRESANAELDAFTATFFDHSMTAEEGDFIAEVGRRAGGAVASKFVNNGLSHLTDMLAPKSAHFDLDASLASVARAGELLRLLAHLVEPSRHDADHLPRIDQGIQDAFVAVFCQNIQLLIAALQESHQQEVRQSGITKIIVFLLRLLQFDLGFKDIWTDEAKMKQSDISRRLVDLLFQFGSDELLDPVAFSVVLDTLYYLIDEVPVGQQATAADIFRAYPAMQQTDIPSHIPAPFRAQLAALCSYDRTNPIVADLVHGTHDATGRTVRGISVQNRPWEWTEYLGEPELKPQEKAKEAEEKEALGAKYLTKNNASISLDLFSATPTGEGIIDEKHPTTHVPWSQRTLGEMRGTEDGLAAESVFVRDWKDTRVDLPRSTPSNGSTRDGLPLPATESSQQTLTKTGGTPRASPAPSKSHSASSRLASPMPPMAGVSTQGRLTGSSLAEAIDVDSAAGSSRGTASSTRGQKRKASTANLEPDPVPEPPRPMAGKKTKAGKAPAKTTAKKGKKK